MRRSALFVLAALAVLVGVVALQVNQGAAARLASMVRVSNEAAREERPAAESLELQLNREENGNYVVTLTNTGTNALDVVLPGFLSVSIEFYDDQGQQLRINKTNVTLPEGMVGKLEVIRPKEAHTFIAEREAIESLCLDTRATAYVIARYRPDSGVARAKLKDCDASGIEILSDPLELE